MDRYARPAVLLLPFGTLSAPYARRCSVVVIFLFVFISLFSGKYYSSALDGGGAEMNYAAMDDSGMTVGGMGGMGGLGNDVISSCCSSCCFVCVDSV